MLSKRDHNIVTVPRLTFERRLEGVRAVADVKGNGRQPESFDRVQITLYMMKQPGLSPGARGILDIVGRVTVHASVRAPNEHVDAVPDSGWERPPVGKRVIKSHGPRFEFTDPVSSQHGEVLKDGRVVLRWDVGKQRTYRIWFLEPLHPIGFPFMEACLRSV